MGDGHEQVIVVMGPAIAHTGAAVEQVLPGLSGDDPVVDLHGTPLVLEER